MVDREAAVVRRPLLAEGVLAGAQRAVEAAADQQAARDADGAQRVEAVGILHHPRLGGPRRDTGAVAVRLDGVKYVRQQAGRVIESGQEGDRRLGGEPRCLHPAGAVLGHRDAIVQTGCRQGYQSIYTF